MKKLPAIISIAFLLASGASGVLAGQECLLQLEQHCTSCHYKTRVCNKLGKKNNRAWQKTIKRMLRYGLKLEKSEQEEIADCLVSLADNPKPFCD